jgi:predicted PurR-regulated permease PerM
MDHPIVITFMIFAVIAFMSLAAEVLKPLALAVLLSFALAPIADFLERRGLARALAVVLTVLLALGVLAGVGYKVGEQLTALAKDIDRYERNIGQKVRGLSSKESTLEKLSEAGSRVAKTLDRPPAVPEAVPVNVVSQPSFTQRLQRAVGPYLEAMGVGSFVLILVLFILVHREDLGDRIIRLCGESRVSLTTKTLDEVGRRISRYLAMFATVNSAMGVVVGFGLGVIGVPYAVLWGVIFALLRFVPYVGPAAAFALPLIFSVAYFPGWREPLMVVGLFAAIETLANTFLEPVLYGRTTGVSALGLLVAAMFWTWLWGALGLLLSTPMTVCLAVLGKYVPALGVFATLLSEGAPLDPDVRFYQRLLALDQDGATQWIDGLLQQEPRAEVFDQVLVPALSRAERDRARDEIDDRQEAFIWRMVGDTLDELGETPEVDLKTLAPAAAGQAAPANGAPPVARLLAGVAASDNSDALVLKMLSVLLAPWGCTLEIVRNPDSPLKLAERLAEIDPGLVVLSHLPPGGATTARYLVRRLRARFPELPILVGRWGEAGDTAAAVQRLTSVGASDVVFRLADARDRIVERFFPKPSNEGAPLPEPAASQPATVS